MADLAGLRVAFSGLALAAQGAGDLGNKRKRTDAPPEFMAEDQQDEDSRRHDRSPEDRGTERIRRFDQAAALHRHALIGQSQRTPGVIRTGEAGRERVEEQRSDDQQPTGGEQPSHPVHAGFADTGAGHLQPWE